MIPASPDDFGYHHAVANQNQLSGGSSPQQVLNRAGLLGYIVGQALIIVPSSRVSKASI